MIRVMERCTWLVLAMLATTVSASEAGLDKAAQAEIVEWAAHTVDQFYVYPDVGKEMAKRIRKRLKEGKYEAFTDASEIARALTRDLQEVSKDEHLKLVVNMSPPTGDDAGRIEEERRRREALEMARENFRFRKVEWLDGNVGYIRFDGFENAVYAGAKAVAAMNAISGCDAVIVDLRYNDGGYTNMLELILSYFFESPEHFNTFYDRDGEMDSFERTWGYVPGPRLTDADVYVLTSRGVTFSAAESFAAMLQARGRATIVGEQTVGGSHPIAYHYLRTQNLQMNVPVLYARDPVNDRDWEGEGITPDVPTSASGALDAAYLLALENLYEAADGDEKASLAWWRDYQKGTSSPVEVSDAALRSYAGQYGPLSVTYDGECLWLTAPGQSTPQKLGMVTSTLFVIHGDDSIRGEFEIDGSGGVKGIIAQMENGQRRPFPRSN